MIDIGNDNRGKHYANLINTHNQIKFLAVNCQAVTQRKYKNSWRFMRYLLFSPHVIVEAPLNRRTIAQVTSIMTLHGLSKDVGTWMPEHILTYTDTQTPEKREINDPVKF
jgi:hypothetical protein